jgi:hypothetical protein
MPSLLGDQARSVGRIGLISAGLRQHSHSWFRVPRDTWPCFIVSGLWKACNGDVRFEFIIRKTDLAELFLENDG